jgi:2-polyprenyl-6-hydroxyphenyl methylase/3-demethylubiquinone-9 3-methyltransferase
LAREHYPGLDLHPGSAYDDLAGRYGRFPVVVSLEVVEHLYYPRKFAQAVFDLLTPGGIAVVSTPYHGYWKNLALAVTGKLDAHFTALWDHGHIKFWSPRTLTALLAEAGLTVDRVIRAGRVPVLAKSMILVARKPV